MSLLSVKYLIPYTLLTLPICSLRDLAGSGLDSKDRAKHSTTGLGLRPLDMLDRISFCSPWDLNHGILLPQWWNIGMPHNTYYSLIDSCWEKKPITAAVRTEGRKSGIWPLGSVFQFCCSAPLKKCWIKWLAWTWIAIRDKALVCCLLGGRHFDPYVTQ